ncbi:MAG: RloB domain-containing protein [Victivallales bacterium]|jgi:hypothetical protein|nr:RloB domain-containing protein [Victivallales bacterium]MBT7165524.1 RloB domain-containing protein [Victivallales bacterium]MBT7300588.1 RloB domain-containing protein [Victivallales bacterium]
MALKRRTFRRPTGVRRYRKLFIIAAEGAKTEPQYFTALGSQQATIRPLKGRNKSSPQHVLKRMEEYLKGESLRKSDEAWLVVDKDQWTDDQLGELHRWAQKADNYGLALSNPSFEYWVLLHFEDGTGISSARACTNRLREHLPDYDKGIDARKITQPMIGEAIRRAKLRDNPPCADWPRALGGTTVYRLVERITQA